jgi:contact-dependent growth inhibition (CDI) system CdiI-like immunity protein
MALYSELETLIGGWFHQDFDINGRTIAEIVSAYRRVTPEDQQRALIADIHTFLAQSSDVDRDFQDRFKPDIIPTAFAPTTRAFLEQIVATLRREPS